MDARVTHSKAKGLMRQFRRQMQRSWNFPDQEIGNCMGLCTNPMVQVLFRQYFGITGASSCPDGSRSLHNSMSAKGLSSLFLTEAVTAGRQMPVPTSGTR